MCLLAQAEFGGGARGMRVCVRYASKRYVCVCVSSEVRGMCVSPSCVSPSSGRVWRGVCVSLRQRSEVRGMCMSPKFGGGARGVCVSPS